MINDEVKMGETVSAVLKNVKTGEKRTIDCFGSEQEPRYKVEIRVTDLRSGAVYTKEELKS